MVRDGVYYGLGFGAVGALVGLSLSLLWALPLFALGAFCLYFFRDPDRSIPTGELAVSPADGAVTHIRSFPNGSQRVSVFLNLFSVHVNRIPVGGRIAAVEHKSGAFRMAYLESASERNEQVTLTVDPPSAGTSPVIVKQIAGLVARRIVCDKKAGETTKTGERFGMIKFGSRMDVVLGPEWELTVNVGDRVLAGSSVLARLRGPSARAH